MAAHCLIRPTAAAFAVPIIPGRQQHQEQPGLRNDTVPLEGGGGYRFPEPLTPFTALGSRADFFLMSYDFDLFGNPVDAAGRKAGRPEHEPTQEMIINIMVLLAAGMTNKEVAQTVGISVPTLRKHYFHLTRNRDVLLNRLQAKLRTAQIQQGLAGNAAALAGALRTLDTVNAERVSRTLSEKTANQPASRSGYVSKKEQRIETAREIGGKYAVPAAPRLVASNGQSLASEDGE